MLRLHDASGGVGSARREGHLIGVVIDRAPIGFHLQGQDIGLQLIAFPAGGIERAIGHLMIGADYADKRTVLAVECAVRHPGLAIAIGTTNFTAQETLPVLIPCILTFMVIANVYLFVRARNA